MLWPRDRFAPLLVAALLAGLPGLAGAAGRLVVERAWIRSAPPAAPMRAGYATLRNAGDAPLAVKAARSAAFGDVSIHATQIEDGVARMRELDEIALAPGEQVTLAPGGMHLMLMQPRGEMADGGKAVVTFEMRDGSSTDAEFAVRDAAAAAEHEHHSH